MRNMYLLKEDGVIRAQIPFLIEVAREPNYKDDEDLTNEDHHTVFHIKWDLTFKYAHLLGDGKTRKHSIHLDFKVEITGHTEGCSGEKLLENACLLGRLKVTKIEGIGLRMED